MATQCSATVREDVKLLQKCLRRLGYFPIYAPDGSGIVKINGKFCYYTSLAVVNFQKDHGITPTGVVDKKTKEAIRREVCPPNPAADEIVNDGGAYNDE